MKPYTRTGRARQNFQKKFCIEGMKKRIDEGYF